MIVLFKEDVYLEIYDWEVLKSEMQRCFGGIVGKNEAYEGQFGYLEVPTILNSRLSDICNVRSFQRKSV